MTNPEILDLAEKFPELNGVSFETIIGYTSAILQAASAAPAAVPVIERGPWEVSEWGDGKIAIQSNDFTHDVALEVTGDFPTSNHKLEHAEHICSILNAAPVSRAQTAGVPEGHKIVPIEPTPKMVQAYLSAVGRHIPYAASDPAIVSGYIAMLDAAPSLPDDGGAK